MGKVTGPIHFWICPKCESVYLDEPRRCSDCGYDNT